MLSANLPELSGEQRTYAQESVFNKLFVRHRKTVYCLECGHNWKDESKLVSSIAGITCPSCGNDLKEISHYSRGARHADYWAILTTAGGFQVIRMFIIYKHMKKHQPVKFHTSEVMQHWIDEKGKCVTFSKSVLGLTGYVDNWILSSDLEPRKNTYTFDIRKDISPAKIYPKRRILPIIRRNGFKKGFYGISPRTLFMQLLSNPKAETLIKANQVSLLRKTTGQLAYYWPSVKICIRNNYIVKDSSLFFDYIDMLANEGKDILNPKFVCPPDLKKAHDRLVAKINERRRKEKLAQAREQVERDNAEYVKAKARFFDLHFKARQIDIVPLKSVQEFVIEGDLLKHCIFASNYHKKKDTLLFSARKNGNPVETVEVSLKEFKVVQARGLNNKASKFNKLIVQAVEQNMGEIARLCRV